MQTSVFSTPENFTSQISLATAIQRTFDRPFKFSIDIVDACNLRCPNCPRGAKYEENTSTRMSLDRFGKLLEKAIAQCHLRTIEFYNWTEPLVHPELDKFIVLAKSLGIGSIVSSNFSLKRPALIEAVVKQNPVLIISVSGFTQEIQELYHVRSNIELIKANLKLVARIRNEHGLATPVEVHCLQFADNREDQLRWREFCEDHGFIYVAKPASPFPGATPENVKRMLYKPEFETSPDGSIRTKKPRSSETLFRYCNFHNKITIDARCDVYLCCIYWNNPQQKIGNFLEMSMEEIQRRRLSQDDCSHCTMQRSS